MPNRFAACPVESICSLIIGSSSDHRRVMSSVDVYSLNSTNTTSISPSAAMRNRRCRPRRFSFRPEARSATRAVISYLRSVAAASFCGRNPSVDTAAFLAAHTQPTQSVNIPGQEPALPAAQTPDRYQPADLLPAVDRADRNAQPVRHLSRRKHPYPMPYGASFDREKVMSIRTLTSYPEYPKLPEWNFDRKRGGAMQSRQRHRYRSHAGSSSAHLLDLKAHIQRTGRVR